MTIQARRVAIQEAMSINQLSKVFGANEIMGSSFFHHCYGIHNCQRPNGLELDDMVFWENEANINNFSSHFAKERRKESVPVLESDGSWLGATESNYYWEWAITKTLYRVCLSKYGLESGI